MADRNSHNAPRVAMRDIWRVLRYLRPYRRLALGSMAIMVAGALASVLSPWPLKILVDNVLGDQLLPPWLAHHLGPRAPDRSLMLALAVAAGLLVTLLTNLLNILENYFNTKLNLRIGLDFRSELFQHTQRLSMSFHDQRRSGMLLYLINYQCDATSGLIMAVPPLAQSALTLLGMSVITFLMDPRLALLSMMVAPLLYHSVGYYVRHIQPQLYRVKGLEGETVSILHEALTMLRVIVAFGREDHEYRRFRDQGERAINARVGLTIRQTLFSLVVNMTTALGTALVLGYGATRVLRGRLTVGQLLVVMSYVGTVYKLLETISKTVGSLQDQLISLRITFDLLDTQPEIEDSVDAVAVNRAWGHIRFEDLQFNYNGRVDTLRDIQFEIKPGQKMAIVGPTGAGKTTLVSLIPRFYDPSHGRILLDGTDIRQMTLKSLRRQVSLVQQESLLFSDTVANNIRYGRLDATMDEIIAAAQAANAHGFIMDLPERYETVIGERGARLSGGERQRIAIARAFLKDAPILILDEPTSAIDSRTEAVILEALERLMEGRTTLLVAHRLSTIRNADIILVVNHGRIVECGTHADLIELGGIYRQLYEMQTRARRPA